MAKKTIKDNPRVEVSPSYPMFAGTYSRDELAEYAMRECRSIEEQVRRHVDQDGAVTVYDIENVCEFCGSGWTEESDAYNGGCCDKDVEAAGESEDE